MSQFRSSITLASAVVAVMAIACSAALPGLPPADGKIAIGTWGGDSGGLMVADTAMHLHIACTFGDVSGRVALDTDGRFTVPGRYMLRAYPIAVGPYVPATFTGQVLGSTITVSVTVNDTVQHATVVRGPVTLTLGVEPRMANCPICRNPYVDARWRAAARTSH